MEVGAFTDYIDLAQIALYIFWGFFFALILYIRREDKREGYPLESDRSSSVRVQGFPAIPAPKKFLLEDGRVVMAPRDEPPEVVENARPMAPWPGAPLEPIGDPMLAGVGSGAYARRPDSPELSLEGEPKIQPLRVATDFSLDARDPELIGMPVLGLDKETAGTVVDAWVDVVEPQVRYVEVELSEAAGGKHVMLPMALARVNADLRVVQVNSITAAQFRNVPTLARTDQITMQEEELVVAYYGAGQRFATEDRVAPLL